MRGHLDCCADVEVEQVREISEGFARTVGLPLPAVRPVLVLEPMERVPRGRSSRRFGIPHHAAEAEKMMRGSVRGLLEHRDAIAVLNGSTVRRVRGFGPV